MLKHIAIRDFAIVDELDIDFEDGMTVITGETGAGKSIMLDALGLCVGDRADTRTVRPGCKRADITAIFDIEHQPDVRQWLTERELDTDANECILRRTIGADGRSRAFINGAPSTLADCAELGERLVDIHSQHAHQSLLRKANQRELLDAYAGATELAAQIASAAERFHRALEDFESLAAQSEANHARQDLLTYQVEELDALSLGEAEIESLESEAKTLENLDFLIASSGSAMEGCEQQAEQLAKLRALIEDDRHESSAVGNIRELLASAAIQLDEARGELQHYAEKLETDPRRLTEVRDRLESIYDLARKHRVMPEQLLAHHQALQAELEGIADGDNRLEALQQAVQDARTDHQSLATKLSKKRKKASESLADKVMRTLAQLAMERCQFTVQLSAFEKGTVNPRGLEDVEFLISTNPGAAPGALSKIASGGELSRISLALQVAAAEGVTTPTMIFDEVDVGIGGAVAEVVGALLQQLAQNTQILCVTHLAQVAAQGNHHFQVSKDGDEQSVRTALSALDQEQRVMEIARMLGGMKITDSTRAHAREMLQV